MLQYVSQLYVQVPLSSLRYNLLKCCNMYLNCMFPKMLQYDSKLYVQVLLSSYTFQPPEMLQYDSKLYVQVLLSSYVTSS